jgi:hypothetical protein
MLGEILVEVRLWIDRAGQLRDPPGHDQAMTRQQRVDHKAVVVDVIG